jgi:hypothetical protein
VNLIINRKFAIFSVSTEVPLLIPERIPRHIFTTIFSKIDFNSFQQFTSKLSKVCLPLYYVKSLITTIYWCKSNHSLEEDTFMFVVAGRQRVRNNTSGHKDEKVIRRRIVNTIGSLIMYLLLLLFLLLPLGAEGIRETLVSLQFLTFRQSVGLLKRGISPSQGRYLTQTQTIIYALSGIGTHGPSVRASEDSSCLRPRRHCDQLIMHITDLILLYQLKRVG